jgi:glycosyltransferase involved in cell wall biosynthesis
LVRCHSFADTIGDDLTQELPPHSVRAAPERAKVAFISQPRDTVTATEAQVGSVTIVMWELAKRMASQHDVVVFAPRGHGQPLAETWRSGLRIQRIPLTLRLFHKAMDLGTGVLDLRTLYFASRLFFREYGMSIARALRSEQPDIIHLQSTTQFLPLLHAAVPRARLILHVHDEFLALLPERIIRPRLAHVSVIVTCSDFVTQRLRERLPWIAARIHTVGNGVDTKSFSPPQRPADRGRFRILYVGRVSPEKGIHTLLAAFVRLAEQDERVELDIVGPKGLLPFNQIKLLSGDSRIAALKPFYGTHLWAYVDKQLLHGRDSYWRSLEQTIPPHIRSRVRLHGQLTREMLQSVYRRTHVLVIPSLCMEPFGLPLAEAMASGLPCIASRAGGIPDILVDQETGLLVERGNVETLTDALRRLANSSDECERLGRQARLRAERYFDWSVAADRLESLYREQLAWGIPRQFATPTVVLVAAMQAATDRRPQNEPGADSDAAEDRSLRHGEEISSF